MFWLVSLAAAAAALIVLAVLAAEIYLRIKFRDLLWIRIYPKVYVPDDDLGYRYRPGVQGEIRIPGIHRRFRINRQGFHARDFADEKPPDTYRIAFVGTSNTTGIWMDGEGQNFCEMLEEQLRAAGHRVEVLNFGIDGRFRAVHELRILHTDVAAYDPDLVLLDVELPFVYGSFKRDVYKGYVMIYNAETELSKRWCEATIDLVERRRFAIALYRASYIVRAAARLYMNTHANARSANLRVFVENRIQAPDIVLLPYSLKKSVEALVAAREELARRGAELVVFQCSANPYYRQVTDKYGLEYLELDVPPTREYVHDHDGHYRYAGHVAVARQLFEKLSARETLARFRARPQPVES